MTDSLNEPLDDDQNSGGRVVLLLVLGLLVLLGGGYLAAYSLAADHVPRGTTVAGIDIGGQSPAQAEESLRAGLSQRAAASVRVTAGDMKRSVTPAQAGLSVDYTATVAEAGGERSWDPVRLWDYYTGGQALDPVVDFDGDAMQALLADLATKSGTKPVDGAVRFIQGRVKTTAPKEGQSFDPVEAGRAIQDAYLSDDPSVTLPLAPEQPTIDEADVQAALNDFANAAVSGSVTLDFGTATVKLAPREFTRAIVVKAVDGRLVPRLKQGILKQEIDAHLGEEGAPVPATVALVDGVPTVVPDQPGVGYDIKNVARGFLDVVARDQDRRLVVKATVAEATFKTADAEKLGIDEKVSEFITYFPYAEYRNVNIGRAAVLVNGTVLKPGETFSLNGIVGERTVANGFTKGYIIQDGILIQDLGGGVSQMATTLFNAMFFAGLEDVEHKPHSFYIDRYPVGREATVAWGSVDLQFRNDTPYGVLIDAHVIPSTVSTSGVVTVRMYSTKYWAITSDTGDRYNITKEKVRRIDDLKCHENDGYGGFDIDVIRRFAPVGDNTTTRAPETFHTRYIPSDTVICTNPDAVDE